jgi:hypothetical protein
MDIEIPMPDWETYSFGIQNNPSSRLAIVLSDEA